jgi:hypothetical protein
MMVIVPIDAEVGEAQNITQKYRNQRRESVERLTTGHLQLEHHYCDDDGNDRIAEGFNPVFFHRPLDSRDERNTRRARLEFTH